MEEDLILNNRVNQYRILKRLEKLMMTGIYERYVIFANWGFPHEALKDIDLTGTPAQAIDSFFLMMDHHRNISWHELLIAGLDAVDPGTLIGE